MHFHLVVFQFLSLCTQTGGRKCVCEHVLCACLRVCVCGDGLHGGQKRGVNEHMDVWCN